MTSDHAARARQYQDALYEALAGESPAASDADALTTLGSLIERCRPAAAADPFAVEALDALQGFAERPSLEAALTDVTIRFESPQRFREALYFARCLERDAASALALLDTRSYLEAATPGNAHPELAVDQAALLDGNTFSTLWTEPARGSWLVDTIEVWKGAYLPVYVEAHAAYNAAVEGIARQIDSLEMRVAGLERLNTLERLGSPQALAALDEYHELESLFACPAGSDDLATLLRSEPACPHCGYRLGDDAPAAAAERVAAAIERGLQGQQARLAQRVVRRLLERPGRAGGDRLDRFIEVVQASDLTGLAGVLDDGLVAFLRDLLEAPEASQTLIDRLAQAFPEITNDNLEDAIVEIRVLIQDELERNGGRLRLERGDAEA